MVQFTVFCWSHPIINNDPLQLYGVIKCHCNILLPLFYFYCFGPQSAKKMVNCSCDLTTVLATGRHQLFPLLAVLPVVWDLKLAMCYFFGCERLQKLPVPRPNTDLLRMWRKCANISWEKNDTCKIGKTLSFDILRLCLPSFLLELW